MINPLQKITRAGAPYVRFPDIQAQLLALDHLSPQELIARCQIPEKEPGSVPSECVLTFVRREWVAQNQMLYEPLLEVLLERLRRRLPRAVSRDGKTESLVRSDVAEQVQDTFIGMLMNEVNGYDERLDFYEISFSQSLANLSLTAKSKAGRSANRREELFNEEDGEVRAEVEEAKGTFNPFDPDLLREDDYRSRLPAAMEQLNTVERRIVEMLRNNIPIYSKNPDVVDMVDILDRSEKGIRNIRDRAFAKLRDLLTYGDDA